MDGVPLHTLKRMDEENVMNLFDEIIVILEERLGFHVPSIVFWFVLICVVIALIKRIWGHDIKPMLRSVQAINLKIDKIDKIDELEEKHWNLQEESRKSDEKLESQIVRIETKLDVLSEKLDKKVDHDNEVRRGELKDHIRQNYGYYHSRGYITPMELEALKGLINSYEKSGGSNSFVHSIVEPEMYTWICKEQ